MLKKPFLSSKKENPWEKKEGYVYEKGFDFWFFGRAFFLKKVG